MTAIATAPAPVNGVNAVTAHRSAARSSFPYHEVKTS